MIRLALNCRFRAAAEVTGVQRYAWNLLYAFKSPSSELSLVEVAPRPSKRFLRLGGVLWEQFGSGRSARLLDADLVHHPSNTGPILGDLPFVLTIHDVSVLRQPDWYSTQFRHYYRALLPLAARRARLVLTVSEFSKGEIAETLRIPESKIVVVGNTLSVPEETVAPTIARPFILTVGSLSPRKNLGRLLTAFEQVRHRTGFDLVVVGASSSIFANANVTAIDGVHFLGRVSDGQLFGLYRQAAVFVLPSLYEGFGIPLLEAFHSRVPVACSETTGLWEVAAGAAVGFDPTCSESMTAAILRILEQPSLAECLRIAGLSRLSRYSPENFRVSHLSAYSQAIDLA